MQPFKGVQNYFTVSLLYQKSNKPVKEPLPNDVDNGYEADSESEEDVPDTFIIEPIVAYLNDSDCNNLAENKGEWVLNENVAFGYSLYLEDVFKSVDISFFHMSLPISEMACMNIEDNEGSVFIVPPSKRDESPIVFGRGQTQTTTFRESDDDLELSQFFHDVQSAHYMMKKWGTT